MYWLRTDYTTFAKNKGQFLFVKDKINQNLL
jgi:hypothetical protein